MGRLIRIVACVMVAGLAAAPAAAQDFDYAALRKIAAGTTNQGAVGALSTGFLGTLNPSVLTGFRPTAVAVSEGNIYAAGISPSGPLLIVLANRSNGTFSAPHAVFLPGFPQALAAGHIDLDGVPDIVVAVTEPGPIEVFSSLFVLSGRLFDEALEGNGVDAAVIPIPTGAGVPLSITIERLNADAFGDIGYVTSDNLGGEVSVIFSQPQGELILGPSTTSLSAPILAPLLPGPHPQAVAADVLNVPGEGGSVDAVPDIAVATAAGVQVFTVTPDALQDADLLSTDGSPVGVVLADVTRDNLVDIIALNAGSGEVSTNVAQAGGGYDLPSRSVPVGANPISLALINFNNDGVPDVVVASLPPGGMGSVTVLQGNGTGGFTSVRTFTAPGSPVLTPIAVATGRLDPRSTTDDIVIGDAAGGIAFLSAAAGYRPVPVTPAVLPDLTITEAVATPAGVIPGGTVSVVNTVRSGLAPSGPITVRFLLSGDAIPGPDDTVLGTRVVLALGANATSRETTALTIPANTSTGQRRILVVADPANTIPETNENNNDRATGLITVVLPDLTVRTVMVTPLVIGTGANASVVVVIANVAPAPGHAPATTAEVYLSRNGSAQGAIPFGSIAVPALAAGGTATLTLRRPLTGLPPGRYFVVVVVDPADQVREMREDNNAERSLLALLLGADPALTRLAVAPARVVPGGTVAVTETLANAGGDAVDVDVSLALVPVTAAGVPTGPDIPLTPPAAAAAAGSRPVFGAAVALGPASTRMRVENVPLPGDLLEGDYRVRGTLNVGGLPNADTTNDSTLSNAFRVALPDLVVRSVTVTPAVAGTGANVSVVVIIANAAGAPASAPATTAEVYLSRNGSVEGALLLGTVPVPALAGGGTATLTLRRPVMGLSPGRYFVVVRVDPANQVREVQEGNNTGRSHLTLLFGADPAVSAVTVAPTRVIPGGRVTVSETLSNPGGDPVTVDLALSLVRVTAAGVPTGPDIPLPPPITGISLGPLAKRLRADSVQLPDDLADGDYRVRATLNPDGSAPNADPANDTALSNVFRVVLPDLVVRSVTVTPVVGGTGANASVVVIIANAAGAPASAPATTAEVYLSRNGSVEGALLLGTVPVPALAGGGTATLTLRRPVAGLSPGRYFVVVRVDPANQVREVREDNNDGRSLLTLLFGADPSLTGLAVAPARAIPGGIVTVSEKLGNPGGDAVSVTLALSLVPVTPAGAPAGPDVPLPAGPPITLGPAGTRTRMESVPLPGDLPERDYRLRGTLNPDGAAPNADTANDSLLSNTFRVVLPDLVVRGVTMAPAVLGTAANASVVVTIANAAGAPASAPASTAEVYLSRNGSVEGAVLLGTVPVPALAAGGAATLTLRQPLAGLSPGRYFAVVRVDPANQVREAQEGNNLGRSATTVLVGADPAVTAVSVTPVRAVPGSNVSATTTLSNPGADAVTVDLAFSLLPVTAAGAPAGPEIPLALPAQSPGSAAAITGIPLAANSKRVRTDSVPLPSDLAVGNYRLRATVNAGGTAPDADPGNDSGLSNVFQTALPDWVVRTVTFTPATVGTGSNTSATGLVSGLAGVSAAVGGGTLSVVGVVANLGTVPTPATTAEIFLSGTPSVDGALPIGTGAVPVVPPGGSTTQTWRLLLPYVPAGRYHVVVRVDGLNALRELIETNNVGASLATLIVSAGPVITSTPPGSARPGVLYTYDVEAADPESDRLTFRLLTSPTGMTIDSGTGLIRWTPAASQIGTHQIAVRVTDPAGNVADQRFTLRVDGDGIPDAGAPGNLLEIVSPASGFVTSARTLDVTVRFTAGPGAPDHPGRLLRALVLAAGGLQVARADLPAPATERTHTFSLDLSAHPEGATTLQALGQGAGGLIAVSALASVRIDRDVSSGALVGPGGGVLTTADGALTLTVPAGALSDLEWIIARTVDPSALPPLAAGVALAFAYELRPHGLQFAQPVDVAVRLPGSTGGGAVGHAPVIVLNQSGADVEALGDQRLVLDLATGEAAARGSLLHFSNLFGVLFEEVSVRVDGVPDIVEVGDGFIATATVTDTESVILEGTVAYSDPDLFRLRRVEPSPSDEPFVILGALRGLAPDRLSRELVYVCAEFGMGLYRAQVLLRGGRALAVGPSVFQSSVEVLKPVFCHAAEGTAMSPSSLPASITTSIAPLDAGRRVGESVDIGLRERASGFPSSVSAGVDVRVVDLSPGVLSEVPDLSPAELRLQSGTDRETGLPDHRFSVGLPSGSEQRQTLRYTCMASGMTTLRFTFVYSFVADGQGTGYVETLLATVTCGDAGRPPVVTSSPPPGAVVGVAYTYDVEAVDPEGQELTYSLADAPLGMRVDFQTGVITWTPDAAQVGPHEVVVLVTDATHVVEHRYTVRVTPATTVLVEENERLTRAAADAFTVGSTSTTTVAGSQLRSAVAASSHGSTNRVSVAGSNGFAVLDVLTGEVVVSLLDEGPWFGAIVVRNELGNGQDAVVRYGPNGSAVNIFDPDRGEFGLTLVGRGTLLDASHIGGNSSAPAIIQVGHRDVLAARVVNNSFGAFLGGPVAPLVSASSLPGVQTFVSAFAYDLLRLSPLGELAADSTGWVLVITNGTPGRAYLLNPRTPFAEGLFVGEVGDGPRTVRCLQSHGICAVVNFVSRTATIILWDGQSTATIVGHVPIDDGAVTPDLRPDGANAALITSGFNSNTATRTTLAPDGSVVARETRPVSSACQGPAHALWLQGTWLAVLSCNLSSSLEVLEFTGGVVNNPPTASFTHGCNDVNCFFDSAASSDPDPGDTVVRRWDFGDGRTAGDVVSPEHIYEVPSIYTVRLTVTDNRGASRTTSREITVGSPPTIASLVPSGVAEGSGAFTLTLNGTGYSDDLTVFWNGQPRPTTFVSPTQLTAQIPASDVAAAGTAQVRVSRSSGGFTSEPVTFTISEQPAVLSVAKTGPASVTAGEVIVYALTVTNTGTVPAEQVLLVDPLPAGSTLVEAPTTSAGICTVGGASGTDGVLRCEAAQLAPGDTLTVIFAIFTDSATPAVIENSATASAFNPAGHQSEVFTSNTVTTTVTPSTASSRSLEVFQC